MDSHPFGDLTEPVEFDDGAISQDEVTEALDAMTMQDSILGQRGPGESPFGAPFDDDEFFDEDLFGDDALLYDSLGHGAAPQLSLLSTGREPAPRPAPQFDADVTEDLVPFPLEVEATEVWDLALTWNDAGGAAADFDVTEAVDLLDRPPRADRGLGSLESRDPVAEVTECLDSPLSPLDLGVTEAVGGFTFGDDDVASDFDLPEVTEELLSWTAVPVRPSAAPVTPSEPTPVDVPEAEMTKAQVIGAEVTEALDGSAAFLRGLVVSGGPDVIETELIDSDSADVVEPAGDENWLEFTDQDRSEVASASSDEVIVVLACEWDPWVLGEDGLMT